MFRLPPRHAAAVNQYVDLFGYFPTEVRVEDWDGALIEVAVGKVNGRIVLVDRHGIAYEEDGTSIPAGGF